MSSPASFTQAFYDGYLLTTFGPAAPLVANRYPVAAFNSTPFPIFFALVQIYTDANFVCPSYHGLMKAEQVGTPRWTYRWAQAPTCPWYSVIPADALPIFGAAHTAEIPFVFGNVNNNPPPNGDCNFTAAEDQLSTEFIGFWTSMAANGNPGDQWPEFTTASSRGLNVLNGSSSATPGVVDFSVCSFWDSVALAVAQNSSTSSNSTASGNGTSTSGPPVATYTGSATPLTVESLFAMAIAIAVGIFAFVV